MCKEKMILQYLLPCMNWDMYQVYIYICPIFFNIRKQAQRRAARAALRAQIFRKVCFYEQKYDFWLIRVPFALFKIPDPPKLIKNGNFQKLQFLLFNFVTLCLLTKNYVSVTKTTVLSPLGPLRAQ